MAWTPDTSPRENPAEAARAQAPDGAPGPIRVLLVDDSEAVRDGLSMLLNSRPYCRVVGAVDDPHSAMAVASTEHPHVVLLDFSMPLVDPLALTVQLGACRPRPAVLMLSALANEQSAARAAATGAVGWVLKDAEPSALFTALLRAARSADPPWDAPDALADEILAHGLAAQESAMLPDIPLRRPGGVSGAAQDGAAAPGVDGADAAKKLDARTVRALLHALRAVRADIMGASARELAAHAVVSPRMAERILKRLQCRTPALVATVGIDATECRYVLTPAGEQELERLERHIAGQGADLDAPEDREPCGAR